MPVYVPEPDEKFDYQNLDVKLYLALKKLSVAAMHMVPESIIIDAERAMYEFTQSLGPIPDWAVDRNFGYELVLGAQLCTKDGRRTGNANIVSIETKIYPHLADRNNPYGEVQVYNCLTDAGNKICLSAQELEGMFHIGDWISDPARVIRDFDRNKEFTDVC